MEAIEDQNSEYSNITGNLQIESRPIVPGPVYYFITQVEFLKCYIYFWNHHFLLHLLKDSFDF